MQVSRIHSIEHPEQFFFALDSIDAAEGDGAVLVPARVKWYDNRRGFGIATAFGDMDEILVNAKTPMRCGVGSVVPGEAIALCVEVDGNGKIASAARNWVQIAPTS